MKRILLISILTLATLFFSLAMGSNTTVHAEGELTTTLPEEEPTEEVTTTESDLTQEEIELLVAELIENINVAEYINIGWQAIPSEVKMILGTFGIGTPLSLIAYTIVYIRKFRKTFGATAQLDKDVIEMFKGAEKIATVVVNVTSQLTNQGEVLTKLVPSISYVAKSLNLLIQASKNDEIIKQKNALALEYQSAFNEVPQTINLTSDSEDIKAMAVDLAQSLAKIQG